MNPGSVDPMVSAEALDALEAQTQAADPKRSVWVSANAGTGKTRVLVDRISRLLLLGVAPSRILCLTFTKAAAAEMSNRLSDRLGIWATLPEDDLTRELARLLGEPPDDATRTRGRKLFARVLDVPGGLKIRTIHAFCESLLGRFPLEAGIAPHFSVIDERSEAELLSEARDRIFRQAFEQRSEDLSDALDRVSGLVDENGFAEVIRELASQRSRLRTMLRRHGSVRDIVAAARTQLSLGPNATAESVLARACADGAFDALGLYRASRALDKGTPRDQARAATIRAWLTDADRRRERFLEPYGRVFLTAAGAPVAEKTLITKRARDADPGAYDALRAEQTRILAVQERLKAVAVAEATAALLTIGAALLDAYERLKASRALLDYDDLILAARALLRGGGRVAWVHYKLDGGIDHILVDEAQDTSPAQWDVIAALAEEFFTGESAREAGRTVFAVGDEKQSIYSFQGADPAAFERMRAHFAARAADAGLGWRSVEMPLSFRATPVLLGAVDRVFASEPARIGLTFDHSPPRHLSARLGHAGRIEIWPTIRPEEALETDPWDTPLDQLPAKSAPSRLADRIARQIRYWLDTDEILESEGRLIRPGDIMILVRKRHPLGEEMVRCLKERGIPVAGSDRMVLTEHLAVMDLLALGRFVLLPEDDLSFAEVLKGPFFGWDDDALFTLARPREGTLWQALRDRAGIDPGAGEACRRLAALLDRADFMPPFEFYGTLLGPERGREALLARLGPDAADPIDEFLALALDYEREHVPSLQGFLQWIEAGATEVKRDLEHGDGEVRVLTVHGAKGLQANIVFLPDSCSVPDTRLGARVLWTEDAPLWPGLRANEETTCEQLRDDVRVRQGHEYRRLLYVAMTRARDRLYVCGWETARGRDAGCWYDLVADALKPEAEEVSLEFGETGWLWRTEQQIAPKPAPAAPPGTADLDALPAWARAPAPPEPDPPQPLAPSQPDEDDPPILSPLGPDDGVRFRRGRLIHRLLQALPELPPVRRAAAARTFLTRPAQGLDEATRNTIASEVLRILDDPHLAALFGPGSRAEAPIVGQVGGHVVSGQVDRLLIGEDAITVIDFKTNRPPPLDEAEVPRPYLRQMAAYRALLRLIWPDRAVRCVLLWTDGPLLMPLSDELLDRHAP